MFWLNLSIILARILIEVIFFAIGISVFSFLNVVIYRVPRRMQFTLGKSMCTSCKHELTSRDLIPVISWIVLRGRCRYCGERISSRYTIVELLGGISAVFSTLMVGINLKALLVFVISGIVTVALFIGFDFLRCKGEYLDKNM